MGRTTTQINDKGQDEKANQSHNLDAGEYEFDFSKYSHIDEVEYEDENEDNGDPYGRLCLQSAFRCTSFVIRE